MMKTYRGYTDQEYAGPEPAILVHEEDRPAYKLRHLIVHSPSGLSWGFGGSGPADLALAILADYLGEADAIPVHDRYGPTLERRILNTRAARLHQAFKWQFIAPLDQGAGWTLTDTEIRDWLAPRLPEIKRVYRERQALALIGHRVELDDGGTVDVMDVDGDGEDLRLIVSPLSGGAWFRVELPRVARDIGLLPDDEEE
jgi:hypothetical protein